MKYSYKTYISKILLVLPKSMIFSYLSTYVRNSEIQMKNKVLLTQHEMKKRIKAKFDGFDSMANFEVYKTM